MVTIYIEYLEFELAHSNKSVIVVVVLIFEDHMLHLLQIRLLKVGVRFDRLIDERVVKRMINQFVRVIPYQNCKIVEDLDIVNGHLVHVQPIDIIGGLLKLYEDLHCVVLIILGLRNYEEGVMRETE